MQELHVRISIDVPFSPKLLEIRNIIEDTVASRDLGEVWNTTMGHTHMEIFIDYNGQKDSLEGIRSIIDALGLKNNTEYIIVRPLVA